MDWTATPQRWIQHLHAHDWRLGVGDELLLHTLADRLRERGTPVASADDAVRWFGPLLCGSVDDQRRLLPLLQAWQDAATPPAERLDPALGRVARAVLPGPPVPTKTRLRGAAGAVLMVLAAALGMWMWQQGTETQPATVPAPETTALQPASQPTGTLPVEVALGALLWALPLLTALLVHWLRQRRETTLLRGLAPRDAPKESLEIPLPRFELFTEATLRATVADLRRHRLVPADWIDGRRSVQATVRGGGRVQLLPGRRRAQPEYLLLVDLKRQDDILAALADLLTELLQQGDVRVERLDFHGDPSHLRRHPGADASRRPASIDLASLRATCPDHRVLVLSDASSFCDAHGRQMRPWVDELRQWGEVALLTPMPASQWGPRERGLFRTGIFVTEAHAAGLKHLAQAVRTDRPAGDALADATRAHAAGARAHPLDQRLAVDPFKWLGDRPPAPDEISAVVAELRAALGARAMLYLQALAVFPVLKPRLTLALGRLLADRDGLKLLDDVTLARLCRVPWLRQARMPDWLRSALLGDLTRAPDPSDAARVRAAWATLLAPQSGAQGADTTQAPLSLEVVRSVDSQLPLLVARLLSRGAAVPQRETLLLAFMRGDAIPDLAVALPGQSAQPGTPAGWLAGPWLQRSLLIGAVVLAALGAWLSPWAWDQFRARPGLATAWLPACWTAYGVAGLLAMLSAYRRELAPAWAQRWPWLIPPDDAAPVWRLLPQVSSVAALAFAMAAVQLEGVQPHSLARVVMAIWVTVWCFMLPGRATLAWAPVLVALQLNVTLPSPWERWHEYLSLYAFTPVLMAWLAARQRTTPWEDWRALLLLAMPLWALKWAVAPSMTLGGAVGPLVLTWIVTRAISDTSFRHRWLGPQRLDAAGLALWVGLSLINPSFGDALSLGVGFAGTSELTVYAAVLTGLCVHRSWRYFVGLVPLWLLLLWLRVELRPLDDVWVMDSAGMIGTPVCAWLSGVLLRAAITGAPPTRRSPWPLTAWLLLVALLTDLTLSLGSRNGSFTVSSAAVWPSIYGLLVIVGAVALPAGWRQAVALTGIGVAVLPMWGLNSANATLASHKYWTDPSYWRVVHVLAAMALMLVLRPRLAAWRAAWEAALRQPAAAPPPRLHLLDWPAWLLTAWLLLSAGMVTASVLAGDFRDVGKNLQHMLSGEPQTPAARNAADPADTVPPVTAPRTASSAAATVPASVTAPGNAASTASVQPAGSAPSSTTRRTQKQRATGDNTTSPVQRPVDKVKY